MILLYAALAIFPGTVYQGWVGFVIPQRATITVGQRQSFTGAFEVVPTVWAPITGSLRHSTFKVDGWFSTNAVVTPDSITGIGVELWRK